MRSLGALVIAFTASSSLAVARQAVFRADAVRVTIDVSVRKKNSPVTGLSPSDFELRDNGVLQSVELLAPDVLPVDVSVVFDASQFGSLVGIDRRSNSDLAVVTKLLRSQDRIRVITFSTDVRELFPMQSPEALRLELSRPTVGAVPGAQSQVDLESERDNRMGVSWSDAILLALAKPPEIGRRHMVVAFGSGLDTGIMSFNDALASVAAHSDSLLHIALWNRWPIAPFPNGLPTDSLTYYARLIMTAAAQSTGGSIHDIDNGVDAFKSIVADFRSRYLLEYVPKGVAREGWHDVTVTTPKFPDYKIQARKGYLGR